MQLPKQLQNKKFRFIKIIPNTKRASERNWSKEANYEYNSKEFKSYLSTAVSYGVMGGHGQLAIIDCDEDELVKDVLLKLPDTFTVKTGSGGYHYYFIIKDLKSKILITDNNEKHYGEVQFSGFQCLGPGSLHPNGNKYELVNNEAIAAITKKELLEVIGKYCKTEKSKKFVSTTSSGLNWDISIIAKTLKGIEESHDGVMQGSHPVHGSTGGENFQVDMNKNVWCCYRCGTGGDALTLAGVIAGQIKCQDCTQGLFKGKAKLFREVKNAAIEKYGYKGDSDYVSPYPNVFVKSNKKGDLAVEEIAEYIAKQLTFITLKDPGGKNPYIYVYRDGYYQLNGEDFIILELKKLFRYFNIQWKERYIKEIIGYIQTENIVDRDTITPPKNLINLNNRVYDINTGKTFKHSPKYFFLYKIPWNYKPESECPRIMKYFKSTLKPQYIKLSQEIFGYCLYSGYDIAGIFYLYGTGGNGKKIWIQILENMLGRKNRASKTISALANTRFATALLYGKLLNICGELTSDNLHNTDMLKSLSAGDSVQAEFKGKDGFDFYNRAKLITACNSIPYCKDLSDGWYQRQYIIPFLKKFRDSKQEDIELLDKLITRKEMEGVLIWALTGLKRLLENKRFSYPFDKRKKYLMLQQNTAYYVDKFYQKTADWNDYLLMDDIYSDYKKWCAENDIPVDSQNALGRSLTYARVPIDQIAHGRFYTYIRRYIKKK